MQFSFERFSKETGMCSNAAAVNIKLCKLVKAESGPYYMLALCLNHHYENAINSVLKKSIKKQTF